MTFKHAQPHSVGAHLMYEVWKLMHGIPVHFGLRHPAPNHITSPSEKMKIVRFLLQIHNNAVHGFVALLFLLPA